jgi:phage terminase small subunit
VNKKQKIFADEYLVDLNQTRAYIAAGYSEKGAAQSASALLRNPKVAAYIETKLEKRSEKLGITAERVLAEIAKLAFLDPRKLFHESGNLKAITELDDDTAASIAGVDFEELYAGRGDDRENIGRVAKIKIADKGINLERLGKHLKLFTDKVEHSGKVTLEDLIAGGERD